MDNKSKNKILIAKIDKNVYKNISFKKCKLRLALSFIDGKELKIANIDLQYDILHEISDKAIFKALIKPIEIRDVKGGMIYCK